MAVVELSVLAVLAAVQTCVRGTVGQEDRTPRELRLESGQPGSREGSARQARREIRVVAGELESSGAAGRENFLANDKVTWLSKVHTTSQTVSQQ